MVTIINFLLAEWSTSNGALVCLTNKMYFGFDCESNEEKRSTKGVSHDQIVTLDEFIACLENRITGTNRFTMRNLRTVNDHTVKRISTEKTVLSDLFIKLRVLADRITCEPLTQNGVPL